ncbi:MAG: hypothetical protein AAF468_20095 [Pseudomonadota bacterium]
MPAKYHHRKLSGAEFGAKLDQVGLSLTEFQMLTGRHRIVAEGFVDPEDSKQFPTLADLVIVQTLVEHPDMMEPMLQIAKSFITGDSTERKRS